MKSMKLVIATIVTAILIAVLSSSVYAGTVSSVNATENGGKISVSGTVDSDVYAVAVVIYSGEEFVYMETTSVTDDKTYSVELARTFADGTYTVKVADYNGGTFEAEGNVVVGTPQENNSTNNENNTEGDNATEGTTDNEVAKNNEKSPQTGDMIRNVFIVLAVAVGIFVIASKVRAGKIIRKH